MDPVRGAFEECMWFTGEYEGFDDVSFPSALTHLQKSSEFCSLTHIQCDHFKHLCSNVKPWQMYTKKFGVLLLTHRDFFNFIGFGTFLAKRRVGASS